MRLKNLVMLAVVVAGAVYLVRTGDSSPPHISAPTPRETFRLVHAIGNAEKVIDKKLSRATCDARKREHIAVVAALGVGGSVTCLPDSLFGD